MAGKPIADLPRRRTFDRRAASMMDLLTSSCSSWRMTDRDEEAKRLDEMAALETGLAKAQMLAARADRLRRLDRRLFASVALPLLRN